MLYRLQLAKSIQFTPTVRGTDRHPADSWQSSGLTGMHITCILMHMRTTLNIDDEVLAKAKRLSGLKEKTAIVHAGLEALVALESARRLAALGGTETGVRSVRRRRSRKAS